MIYNLRYIYNLLLYYNKKTYMIYKRVNIHIYLFIYLSIYFNNNQSILEGLIRAMPQLTKRNQLM